MFTRRAVTTAGLNRHAAAVAATAAVGPMGTCRFAAMWTRTGHSPGHPELPVFEKGESLCTPGVTTTHTNPMMPLNRELGALEDPARADPGKARSPGEAAAARATLESATMEQEIPHEELDVFTRTARNVMSKARTVARSARRTYVTAVEPLAKRKTPEWRPQDVIDLATKPVGAVSTRKKVSSATSSGGPSKQPTAADIKPSTVRTSTTPKSAKVNRAPGEPDAKLNTSSTTSATSKK